jgi:hypothetical protein
MDQYRGKSPINQGERHNRMPEENKHDDIFSMVEANNP